VTWLVEGEVWHQDSVGSRQLVHPGQVPLMTAGHGIAHAEESHAAGPSRLFGAQLWVALPEKHRATAPAFEFHDELPQQEHRTGRVTVLAGEIDGTASPVTTYSPLVGASLEIDAGGELSIPLEPGFEHAILAQSPGLFVAGTEIPVGAMLYLGLGRRGVEVTSETTGQGLLLGGEPFTEDLVMWWNFVGRTHDEIVASRATWETERDTATEHRRFGAVNDYRGATLPAPVLPNARLKARGRYQQRR